VEPSQGAPCSLGSSCFPLVPYGGRLREGKFEFENRGYQYPLNALPERHSSHGDGWTRPWLLSELGRRSATMSLEADGSAPFQYRCDQSVSIIGNRVSIALLVRNLSAHRIPVGLGLHPYFANRNEARIKADLPTRWRWDKEMMPVSREPNPDALAFLREGQQVNELAVSAEYTNWNGKATIEWPARNLLVELETSPPLAHVVMWMPSGESFFCFEPMSHATDALNMESSSNPEGYFVLEPNAIAEQHFDFVITQLRSRAPA
jgi:aldose 1-epimerase